LANGVAGVMLASVLVEGRPDGDYFSVSQARRLLQFGTQRDAATSGEPKITCNEQMRLKPPDR